MKKVTLNKINEYKAAGHFKMVSYKLHSKEETGINNFWIGLSHFLPGGGAEMGAGKTEKVYIVLSGKLTVVTQDKKQITLEPMDSLYIPAGEERYLINNEKVPASMLVIISYN